MKQKVFRNRLLSAGILATALAFSGCMTPQQTEQFNQEMAFDYLQDGYNELDAVVDDVDKGALKAAEWHFNKGLNDFENAITYFQKLQLTPNEQAGMKKLHVAITSLQLCVKYLDKNNDDLAMEYYNQAAEAFTEAAVLLSLPES